MKSGSWSVVLRWPASGRTQETPPQKGVSGVNRPLVAAVRPREHVTRLRAPLAHEPARPQHLRFPLAELDDRLLPMAGELAVRDVPCGPGVRSEWGDLLGARRRPHAVPLEGHHFTSVRSSAQVETGPAPRAASTTMAVKDMRSMRGLLFERFVPLRATAVTGRNPQGIRRGIGAGGPSCDKGRTGRGPNESGYDLQTARTLPPAD